MSHSWTKWRQLKVAPASIVGLGVSRTALSMLEARDENGKWTIKDARRLDFSTPLFSGAVREEHRQALVGALRRICADLGKRYAPVNVALPNPVSSFALFELDQLPAGRKAQAELGRWLMTKERFAGKGDVVCTAQPLGQHADKHLLFVQTMDAKWHSCVAEALREAGIVAWSMNSGATYAFNRFHDRMTAAPNGGAVITIDPESCAVLLWDATARVRVVRSRWREATEHDHEREMNAITAEVERIILAYINGDTGREVRTVYVSGAPDDTTPLVSALNARLVDPCVCLPVSDMEVGSSLKPEQLGSFALALAAVHAP